MANPFTRVTKNVRVQKDFDYNLHGISLRFSLFIDVKQSLKDMLAILEQATSDVKEELEKQ